MSLCVNNLPTDCDTDVIMCTKYSETVFEHAYKVQFFLKLTIDSLLFQCITNYWIAQTFLFRRQNVGQMMYILKSRNTFSFLSNNLSNLSCCLVLVCLVYIELFIQHFLASIFSWSKCFWCIRILPKGKLSYNMIYCKFVTVLHKDFLKMF